MLAQIEDGLDQYGFNWLLVFGCCLVMLAFYLVFEDRHLAGIIHGFEAGPV